jgi:hypothetical protein
VVALDETNVRVNNRPLFKLTLELRPMNRGSYEWSKRLTLPYGVLPHLQPGRQLSVLVDPDDPQKVLFEVDKLLAQVVMDATTATDGGESSAHGRVTRLEALKQMHDKGLITQREYEAKKAEILKEL